MKAVLATSNKLLQEIVMKMSIGELATVDNGKDCQVRLVKDGFDVIMLDLSIKSYSGVEVLKFIKMKLLNAKIILFASSQASLKELGLCKDKLTRIGIADVIVEPTAPKIKKSLEGIRQYEDWKEVISGKIIEEKEVHVRDEEFTRQPLKDLYCGNVVVFDLYLRLGKNKYVKIQHKGQSFDEKRIEKYVEDGVEYFYFLTKERGSYINYLNDVLKTPVVEPSLAVQSFNNVAEFFVDEVYAKGIKPELIKEGNKICQNMYQTISRDPQLVRHLRELEELGNYEKSFLISFFSTLICKNLSWSGSRSVEALAVGALLYNIGILKLPKELQQLEYSKMNEEQKKQYRKYPELGLEMMRANSCINQTTLQIISQRQECVDGSGYPRGLTSAKIFPLAKIVSLSSAFADLLIAKKLGPKEGMKLFLRQRQNLLKYDATMIKALIEGFTA